jgi:hypothetical protein
MSDLGGADGLGIPLASNVEDAGSNSEDAMQEFVYVKHRPVHPGRFVSFLKRHFGPLEEAVKENVMPDSIDQTERRWLRGLCQRRRQKVKPGIVTACEENSSAPSEETEILAPPIQVPAPQFGQYEVLSGDGCLWFAGSDDRQAAWRFEADGEHALRLGEPWASAELCTYMEAGERRIEIRFRLSLQQTRDEAAIVEQGDSLSPTSNDEKLAIAQELLRRELDACLLTRAEAIALEAGDQQIHSEIQVSPWECIRDDPSDDVAKPSSWPVLGAVEIIARVICAIPGSDGIGAIGEFMARRLSTALGVPEGLGHEPLENDLQCQPCSEPAS